MTKPRISEVALEYKSPDLLDFDPENPRFAGALNNYSQDKIQKVIFGEPYYASELVDSLLENGFIDYEPLVVKKNGPRFTVIEGNRRLAAIREIRSNPEKYKGRKSDLDQVPVLVFPEKPDEQQKDEMRVYLGVRHLLGFREWPPGSKAQFLELESQRAGGLEQVLKETRLTRAQARRFLIPLRLLKKAKVQIPKGEDFWVLGEALSRSGVQSFLELEVDTKTVEILSFDKKKFFQLLDDLYGRTKKSGERDPSSRVVRDTRELSSLATVLASEKASTVLHAGKSLSEAEIYVDTGEQSLKRLTTLSKQLGVLLKKITKGSHNKEASQVNQAFKHLEDAIKKFVNEESKR